MTDREIEDGIYGLVVTLCKLKETTVGSAQARLEVANWLTQVAATLQVMETKETKLQ